MNIADITTAISTVGFPIVAFGAIFWMMNTTIKELTSTITSNTQAITQLMTYLESKEE